MALILRLVSGSSAKRPEPSGINAMPRVQRILTGQPWRAREHDGRVATIRSNCRWCSDVFEFACWNGEVVRVASALDCHDREAIAWIAISAGISGEMIRD